jgi:phosphonate transport system permease protein
MTELRQAAPADMAGLEARHPLVMRPSWIKRARTTLLIAVLVLAFVACLGTLEFSWPRFLGGFRELGKIATLMLPPAYGTVSQLQSWLWALAETLAIAFLGTLSAALLALPFGFLAARNVVPSWLFRFSLRRGLDSIRGVDTLIWALIWINVVGLGPFAGVLALMTSDFGTFGKLFSEAIEAADKRDGEAITSVGGNAVHRVRFGLIPQVMPVLLSQTLYYFESNTRSATIIGIVGAGGIGLHLSEQIRTLEWQHVSFLILLILLTVALIDWLSARLRFAVIRAAPPGAGAT